MKSEAFRDDLAACCEEPAAVRTVVNTCLVTVPDCFTPTPVPAIPSRGNAQATSRYRSFSAFGSLVDYERASDLPGIAAMAAKNVQPLPEPVVSILGEQVAESELREALALIRAKSVAPVKETPRGLLCVRDFDHRLGVWGG